MWKTLEHWMAASGLGHAPRTVIEELARIRLNDVILPTSTGRSIRIRCITKADGHQQILLDRLDLKLPHRIGEPHWFRNPDVVTNSD